MADNVPISAGVGTSVATDDVGGVHYQRIKLDGGADGVATPIVAGQQSMASSLPVVLASNQSDVPVGGSPIGGVTETAPASDTASSGLNGRLQRIAQRLTSLIALLPASLGQKTKANSLAVTLASDQDALAVVGNVAHGAVDSGNGVKISGVARTAGQPTPVAIGARVDLRQSVYGDLAVGLYNPADGVLLAAESALDGNSFGATALVVTARNVVFDGAQSQSLRTPNTFKAFSALGTGAEVTVWAPGAGKKPRLMKGVVTSSVAGDIVFRDNTAGATILVIPVLAGTPQEFDLGNGIRLAAANNVLTADAPGAGTLSGFVCGTEE